MNPKTPYRDPLNPGSAEERQAPRDDSDPTDGPGTNDEDVDPDAEGFEDEDDDDDDADDKDDDEDEAPRDAQPN